MKETKRSFHSHGRASQYGMTLVELMVSLVLGLILLGSAIQVFQGNKQSYRIAEGLARVQENGRIALQIMAQDLRMVGQLGCGSRRVRLNDTLVFNFNSNNPPAFFDPTYAASNPIQVFDDMAGWPGPETPTDGTEDLLICDTDNADEATCQVSDAIAITRGSETYALTLDNMADASAAIPIRTREFQAFASNDDLYLITDCLRGDLFRGTADTDQDTDPDTTPTTNITPDAALQQGYGQSAMVMPLTGSIYFVASDGSGQPALYRLPLIGNAQPIALGVEGMQIMIGEDTNDDSFADVYLAPAAVGDWSNATSIRISLLIKSPENNVTDVPTPVSFFDGTAAEGVPGLTTVNDGDDADRRLRMTFTTTVTLRNHLP